MPNIYSAGVRKISNKKVKRALESDLANYAGKRAKKKFVTCKMPNGISNFQIEETIKKIKDDDLSNNFVGVFPSDEKQIKKDYK